MRQLAFTLSLALLLLNQGVRTQQESTAQRQVRELAVDVNLAQKRGADPQVRYADLVRLGPWDDRNLTLTRADMSLLAPNEAELRDPLPVFFRVELRRNWPNLRREGPAQYPRSALQIYMQRYGGYQIDNQLYTRVTVLNGEFRVLRDPQPPPGAAPGAAPPPAAGASPGGPSRQLVGEVRVTSPVGAAESAIKANPVDPNLVIGGSNGPGAGQVMHHSSNGGETWATTPLPLGGTCCDPTVDWSSDGKLAYTATLGNCTLSGCGVWFYRSSNNGQTWNDLETNTPGDPRRELTNNGSDKEFLHVDKHAGSSCLDNLYLTWHDANVMQFARSTDRGNAWTTTSFTADPVGIGSDIATDKTGRVYYIWPGTSTRQILVKRSTDCGGSFPAGVTQISATNGAFDFPIPSIEARRAWIYVAADVDLSGGKFGGSIYAAWTDTTAAESETDPNANHTRIQVAFSRDEGSTWTVVTPHETADASTVDRWNQWLAVGPDGKVHVIFYDTRNSTGRSGVDLYHSVSNDGAQTFSAPERVTTVTSPNLTDFFEFGDYNGLDRVASLLIANFTDSRVESGGSPDSQDIYAVGKNIPTDGGGTGGGGWPWWLILLIILLILLLLLWLLRLFRRPATP